MEQMKRINVRLSQEELDALKAIAFDECRHPQEQARFILRRNLLHNLRQKDNDAASTLAGTSDAVVNTA